MQSTIIPTFEASVGELPHPDMTVVSRLVEVAIGDCQHGCKIYADPLSNYTVLAHSAVYGCRRQLSYE